MAQSAPAPAAPASSPPSSGEVTTVVVTGQRAALQSAQKIKQNSEEVVDSIVAADMKLPDRSVTEVLQRVVGVTIDRTMAKGDPEHFSVEGSGVMIRGLSWVRSELNGRDSFSANGGRSLNFEDVPPELLSAVDVYKNPSAEQIEGGIGGLVNLRTAMPFDYKGFKAAITAKASWSELKGGKPTPEYSGLISNRWTTPYGEFGALLDVAYSESATRTDAVQIEPYYNVTDADGNSVWLPKGAAWRTLNFNRKRSGLYGALQYKNDSVQSSLTYFKSKYKMRWDENAIFAQSSPYNISTAPGATFSSNGVLQTGTLTDTADGGINFGVDTRVATRNSSTNDLSWNLRWKASDKWSFNSDLQLIRASTKSLDSTVATGILLPEEPVSLSGGVPSLNFSDADRTYLADPSNYYWAFTQEHLDRSTARENAWRGDVEYTFDNPILNSARFGVRLTQRGATTTNSNPSYNWSPITQTWQQGWDISGVAKLSDPRFSGNTHLHNFTNFFNGKMSVPSLIVPDTSVAAGYPDSYAALHDYHTILCAEAHGGDASGCSVWNPASFGTDPAGTNDQDEHTQSAYSQLRFSFDDLKYPIDGNVGLRYVHTSAKANGYTVFTPASSVPTGATGVEVPVMAAFSQAQNYSNSYNDLLPSLNLKLKATEKLQFRAAFASAISRPDFSDMQAYTTLSQGFTTHTDSGGGTVVDNVTYTGTANGNPMLKPVKSHQFDLTGEWYFAPTGSFTVAAFDKELRDIVIGQTYTMSLPDVNGNLHDFTVTGPINGAKGYARGLEVAFQTYFTALPGFLSGFGIQANYTYVDSKRKLYNPVTSSLCTGGNSAANVNLNLNGCDTNGTSFGDLPLQNLSRNSYNLTLMYDQGPLSARVAYSWRSRSLQAVNVNGTNGSDGSVAPLDPDSSRSLGWALPTYAGAYGQVDGSVSYKITDKLTFGLEGQNLFNAIYKQEMQQHIGMMGRAWFSTGPRYTAMMSYSY